jgi:hypothetical protein
VIRGGWFFFALSKDALCTHGSNRKGLFQGLASSSFLSDVTNPVMTRERLEAGRANEISFSWIIRMLAQNIRSWYLWGNSGSGTCLISHVIYRRYYVRGGAEAVFSSKMGCVCGKLSCRITIVHPVQTICHSSEARGNC